MPPAGVNLIALKMRLSHSWASRSGVRPQLRHWLDRHVDRDQAGGRARARQVGRVADERLRVDPLPPGREPPRLQLGHEQQLPDEPQQPARIAVDHVEEAAPVRREPLGLVRQHLEGGDDRRERRPQLVRYERDEVVLELIGLATQRLPFELQLLACGLQGALHGLLQVGRA